MAVTIQTLSDIGERQTITAKLSYEGADLYKRLQRAFRCCNSVAGCTNAAMSAQLASGGG